MAMIRLQASRVLRVVAVATVGSLGLMSLTRADDGHPSPAAVPFGITKPSKELKLAFAGPGLVADVAIKQGDHVTKDQILATQDDRQDVIALKPIEAEAKSTEKVEYSIADQAVKQAKYDRIKKGFDQRVSTASELEEAKLNVTLAAAQIKLAELEHEQKGYDAEKQRDKIEHMRLHSPIDGVVKKLNVGPGEMADPQSRDGAIVVAKWDPLWIEANLNTAEAKNLQPGQQIDVQYDGETEWMPAKIIFLDQFDYGSDTRLVRLELANPKEKPPGLKMLLKLPAEGTPVAVGR